MKQWVGLKITQCIKPKKELTKLILAQWAGPRTKADEFFQPVSSGFRTKLLWWVGRVVSNSLNNKKGTFRQTAHQCQICANCGFK